MARDRKCNDKERRLLAAVGPTPEKTDAIFRRYVSIPPHKSLAHTLRRQRSAVGKLLEHMAYEGLIHRRVGDDEGHPNAVVFWKD